jgi:hypothetical protein
MRAGELLATDFSGVGLAGLWHLGRWYGLITSGLEIGRVSLTVRARRLT